LLRSVPTVIAGLNSANIMTAKNIVGVTPGSGPIFYLDPHQPTSRAMEWNAIFEKEIWSNTVVKAGFAGTHGYRLLQYYQYNSQPDAYWWYTQKGTALPTGYYSGVATRPFDNTVYGDINEITHSGWSNDTSFQVEVQHRYSHGYAFQLYYVMSNAMRAGGFGWHDQSISSSSIFLPGTVPTGDAPPDKNLNAINRLENYSRDRDIPKHRF